jgi:hypothetical protein
MVDDQEKAAALLYRSACCFCERKRTSTQGPFRWPHGDLARGTGRHGVAKGGANDNPEANKAYQQAKFQEGQPRQCSTRRRQARLREGVNPAAAITMPPTDEPGATIYDAERYFAEQHHQNQPLTGVQLSRRN